jgi:rSAM/selenodomain-associated transferase 1
MKAARHVLGLFAKWPRPGRVKTRLAGSDPASAPFAAAVARAFLLDTIERFSALDLRRVLAFAPPDALPDFANLSQGRFTLLPQSDGDLGQRMRTFLEHQLADGADAVVFIGTDSPTLPVAYVEQAFTDLEQADVVLGPATDGGYYLLGCSRRVPPIFDAMPWGSRDVLAETVTRLADPSWRLALLPPWYDVDTPDDWTMLRGHLAALRRAGVDPGTPHTEALAFPACGLAEQNRQAASGRTQDS